jgi:hypothetical protein
LETAGRGHLGCHSGVPVASTSWLVAKHELPASARPATSQPRSWPGPGPVAPPIALSPPPPPISPPPPRPSPRPYPSRRQRPGARWAGGLTAAQGAASAAQTVRPAEHGAEVRGGRARGARAGAGRALCTNLWLSHAGGPGCARGGSASWTRSPPSSCCLGSARPFRSQVRPEGDAERSPVPVGLLRPLCGLRPVPASSAWDPGCSSGSGDCGGPGPAHMLRWPAEVLERGQGPTGCRVRNSAARRGPFILPPRGIAPPPRVAGLGVPESPAS